MVALLIEGKYGAGETIIGMMFISSQKSSNDSVVTRWSKIH
jgi:hypothetical protein